MNLVSMMEQLKIFFFKIKSYAHVNVNILFSPKNYPFSAFRLIKFNNKLITLYFLLLSWDMANFLNYGIKAGSDYWAQTHSPPHVDCESKQMGSDYRASLNSNLETIIRKIGCRADRNKPSSLTMLNICHPTHPALAQYKCTVISLSLSKSVLWITRLSRYTK